MIVLWRISSSKIETRGSYGSLAAALDAFELKCKRAGLPAPRNYPPSTAGDVHEKFPIPGGTVIRYQGPRDRHGYVYVEETRISQE